MRNFRDAKTMAQALRKTLKSRAVEITHSDSLELIAKAFGYENWNTLSAKIEAARPQATDAKASNAGAADPAVRKTLYCSFCGKSQHDVRKLIAGPAVFICNGCVELCSDIIREELSGEDQVQDPQGQQRTAEVIQSHPDVIHVANCLHRLAERIEGGNRLADAELIEMFRNWAQVLAAAA